MTKTDKEIFDLYIKGEKTQKEIAKELNVKTYVITEAIKKHCHELHLNYKECTDMVNEQLQKQKEFEYPSWVEYVSNKIFTIADCKGLTKEQINNLITTI